MQVRRQGAVQEMSTDRLLILIALGVYLGEVFVVGLAVVLLVN